MQQKHVILLVILGALLALFGIVTMQYLLVLVILVFIVIVLALMDCKQWLEAQVDKIASGSRSGSLEPAENRESIATVRTQIARMEERLDAIERNERKKSCPQRWMEELSLPDQNYPGPGHIRWTLENDFYAGSLIRALP